MKKSIILLAENKNLDKLYYFIRMMLEKYAPQNVKVHIFEMVCEEIFINIAKYAYDNNENCSVEVEIEIIEDEIIIIFKDEGIPFDPLKAREPEVDKNLEERELGGLGIFMVKNSMDRIEYYYENNKNILKLYKWLGCKK
jgi:anti-sigma regulatory factor (Ser/Thr protein kinase)